MQWLLVLYRKESVLQSSWFLFFNAANLHELKDSVAEWLVQHTLPGEDTVHELVVGNKPDQFDAIILFYRGPVEDLRRDRFLRDTVEEANSRLRLRRAGRERIGSIVVESNRVEDLAEYRRLYGLFNGVNPKYL